jgi:hypothetical protein
MSTISYPDFELLYPGMLFAKLAACPRRFNRSELPLSAIGEGIHQFNRFHNAGKAVSSLIDEKQSGWKPSPSIPEVLKFLGENPPSPLCPLCT